MIQSSTFYVLFIGIEIFSYSKFNLIEHAFNIKSRAYKIYKYKIIKHIILKFILNAFFLKNDDH